MVTRNSVEDFDNEYASIGKKVAKKWLEENGCEVYPFKKIIWFQTRKKSIGDIFGDTLKNFIKYYEAIQEFAEKEEKRRLERHYRNVDIGPDFIAKKDDNLFFINVNVNQAEQKKYKVTSSMIAKEHGFRTMVLRINVQVNIQKDIQLIEV